MQSVAHFRAHREGSLRAVSYCDFRCCKRSSMFLSQSCIFSACIVLYWAYSVNWKTNNYDAWRDQKLLLNHDVVFFFVCFLLLFVWLLGFFKWGIPCGQNPKTKALGVSRFFCFFACLFQLGIPVCQNPKHRRFGLSCFLLFFSLFPRDYPMLYLYMTGNSCISSDF